MKIKKTYHVCAAGNYEVSSVLLILNFSMPSLPYNALNPSSGILLLPVTNYKNLAISSLVAYAKIYQSQATYGLS